MTRMYTTVYFKNYTAVFKNKKIFNANINNYFPVIYVLSFSEPT